VADQIKDKLTMDYFSAEFPGWDYSQPVEIPDNVFATQVPIVELDYDLDVKLIENILRKLPEEHVGKQLRIKGAYQRTSRFKGWECRKFLWNYGYRSTYMTDIVSRKLVDPEPLSEPGVEEEKIRQEMLRHGLDYKILLAMEMRPEGYLRPHRDLSDNPNPLLYCWIPITYPAGNELKLYPTGTMTPTLGKVYLFNQEAFVHAVRNSNTTETRLACIGHLNPDTITDEFRDKVTTAINEQYNSRQTN
jgi:hypothetical protein